MKLSINYWSVKLVLLLLATDLVFILLHLIYTKYQLSNPTLYQLADPYKAFSIEQERGYGELFQYIKELWITLLIGFSAWQCRSLLYLSWSLLFFYLLLDDSLQLHETLGEIVQRTLLEVGWLKFSILDIAEHTVSAGIGIFFLFLLAATYHYASDRLSRQVSRYLVVMLFSLALCGIFVDIIHTIIKIYPLNILLACVEDGGEMIIMSLIAGFAFALPDRLKVKK